MIAIATFRKSKAWLQAAGASVILAAALCWVSYLIIFDDQLARILHSPSGGFVLFCLAGFLVSLPFALRSMVGALRQLVFENGAAVWIKNGAIHTWLFSVPLSEVKTVSSGLQKVSMFVEKEAVILQLANGQQRAFPVGALSEHRDTVVNRLNEVIKSAAVLE